MKRLAILAVFLAIPLLGFAADLAPCSYVRGMPGELCYFLCNQVSHTGAQTSCSGTLPIKDLQGHNWHSMTANITRAGASCEPGTSSAFSIDYMKDPSGTAPGVWSHLTTLTGAGSSYTSGYGLDLVPGTVWRTTFTAITDTNCDGAGNGVDVVLCVQP